MSENSGFFKSLGHDRRYSDEHFAKERAMYYTNGVFVGKSSELQVAAATNMTIAIKSGNANIEGRWYENTSDLSLTLENANGVNPRIDRVVIRCDYSSRLIKAVIITGTPSTTPTAPAIVRDGTYFDISLATINVAAGATSITQDNITDTRFDNSICGVVTGIKEIDTSTLFAQYNAEWQDFKGKLSGDVAANLQLQIDSINAQHKKMLLGGY